MSGVARDEEFRDAAEEHARRIVEALGLVSSRLFQSSRPPGLRCLQRAFIGINSKTDITPELAVICRVRSTSTRGNQWSIDLNAPKFLKDPVAAEIAWVHK